jgi:hypothetical protein
VAQLCIGVRGETGDVIEDGINVRGDIVPSTKVSSRAISCCGCTSRFAKCGVNRSDEVINNLGSFRV